MTSPRALTQPVNNPSLIAPAEVEKLVRHDNGVVLLDVRTLEEFDGETGHLPRAILIPVEHLTLRISELEQLKSRTIVAYCRTGHRSATATEILQRHGFAALNMEGGIARWLAEGLPIHKQGA
jgi:rhodanese-related sulfurtransferase